MLESWFRLLIAFLASGQTCVLVLLLVLLLLEHHELLLLLQEGLELLFVQLVQEFFAQNWHFYKILGHHCGLALVLGHHLSHRHLLLKLLLLILLHL